MRPHNLRMNPAKCAFRVKAGHFLGFLVHNKGIEVNANKAKAILEARPPTNKKELQRFIGQVGFLRRFLANAAVKLQPLTAVKDRDEFVWGEQQEAAFRAVKEAFAKPPVLVPPSLDRPLKLYVAASDLAIGSLLAQEDENGKEHAIFFLSRLLKDAETRYPAIQKLCLSLYHACMKLEYIFFRGRR